MPGAPSALYVRALSFSQKSGSFARGRCRRGRSEIPLFCSKFCCCLPLSLGEEEKSEEKRKKAKKCAKKRKMRKKRGKSLRPHLHQPH